MTTTTTPPKRHAIEDDAVTLKITLSGDPACPWTVTPLREPPSQPDTATRDRPAVQPGAVKRQPDARTTGERSAKLASGTVTLAGTHRGPWRDDLVAAVLATTLVGGLFLDGWNHINLQNGALGSFFTIWHALLYAGFSATAGWVISRNAHLYTAG